MSVLDRAAATNPVGLGLAAIGRPAYINLGRDHDLGEDRSRGALEARAHAVLDAAWEAGVRYFDAARSYGLAEAFLASWLTTRDHSAHAFVIGSKWGYIYTGQWRMREPVQEHKDLSVATFRRQLAETRQLLADNLGQYQIHSATIESGVFDDEELLAELAALRRSGVAIGVTVTGPGQAESIDRALEIGIFDTVQATWNLLERSAAPALQRARDAGLGVIVKEALANGRLTIHGADPALLAYARDRDVPPDAVAIAAAISQPWSDVVLSGAVSPEMLASNLRALELVHDGNRAADALSQLSRLGGLLAAAQPAGVALVLGSGYVAARVGVVCSAAGSKAKSRHSFEVGDVASVHGEPVDQRGRGDERVGQSDADVVSDAAGLLGDLTVDRILGHRPKQSPDLLALRLAARSGP